MSNFDFDGAISHENTDRGHKEAYLVLVVKVSRHLW